MFNLISLGQHLRLKNKHLGWSKTPDHCGLKAAMIIKDGLSNSLTLGHGHDLSQRLVLPAKGPQKIPLLIPVLQGQLNLDFTV